MITSPRSGDAKGTALCRGWFKNQLVAGGTDGLDRCAVLYGGQVHRIDAYQVLVNALNASRIEWRPWDIFTPRPIGLVAVTETEPPSYAARVAVDEGRGYNFGQLDPRRGLSGEVSVYFPSENKVSQYEKNGEMLVEMEPVSYALQDLKFVRRRRKQFKEDVHIGGRSLVNILDAKEDQNYWTKVKSVIAYNASYSYYWGSLSGVIRSLPATAPKLDREYMKFEWGLPLKFSRQRIIEVSSNLLPGTSVQATAFASRVTTEVPYTAVLVSAYEDGAKRSRVVNGTYVEVVLSDVRIEFGRPYYTHNGTLSPTTTTTSTTTTTTTPSTTTTTTIPYLKSAFASNFHSRKESSLSANDITSNDDPSTFSTMRPKRRTTTQRPKDNPLKRFYEEFNDEDDNEIEEEDKEEDASRNRRRPNEDLLNGGRGIFANDGIYAVSVMVLFFRGLIC